MIWASPPGNYDFEAPDIVRQLWYELEFYPDSCLSQLNIEWYNSLYSELGDVSEFVCCALEDIDDPSEDSVLDFLFELGFSALRGNLVKFLTTELALLGKKEAKKALDQLFKEVQDNIVEDLSPKI